MEFRPKRGLRLQLIAVLAIALSPLLLLSAVQSWFEYRDERRQETRLLFSTSLVASQDLEAALQRASGMAAAVSSRAFAFLTDAEGCQRAFARIAETDEMIANISLIDTDGRPVCSSMPAPPEANASERRFFQRLRSGAQASFSRVYFGPISRRPVIVAGRRVTSASDGGFAGAIAVSVDLSAASGLLRQDFLPAGAAIALIDEGGVTPLYDAGAGGPSFDLSLLDIALEAGSPGEPERVPSQDFAPGYTVITAPLIEDELGLLIAAPTREINAWGGLDVLGTLLIPTIMWLLALACVWIAIDLFVLRWLTYLGRMARLYGGGRFDLPARRARSAPYEVRELADTMERMAQSLERQTSELEDVVEQRGALLREIHHRVKNNLQIIVSLLNLQAGRLDDERARAPLFEARRRINALAMVHRSLYEAEDLRYVQMRGFLDQLVANLTDVSRDDRLIEVTVHSDEIAFTPDQTAPLALFVTEAVTNAFKHAFEGRTHGRIEVRLSCIEDECVVEVIDDGTGAAEGAARGTGSSLMQAFATQLGGVVEEGAPEGGGHRAALRFPN
ncbi:MAG: sensor histidine kinase [Oceanicaulis sp.]